MQVSPPATFFINKMREALRFPLNSFSSKLSAQTPQKRKKKKPCPSILNSAFNARFQNFTSHFFVRERNDFIGYHKAIKFFKNFIAPKTPLCKRCEKSRAAVSGAFSCGGGFVIAEPANRQALAKASASDTATKRQKEKAAHLSDLINAEDSVPGTIGRFRKRNGPS